MRRFVLWLKGFRYGTRLMMFFSLVLLVVLASLGYSWMVIRSTNAMRIRLSHDRNLTTALLCANLLDEQYDTALSVLKTLARQSQFLSQIQRKDTLAVRKQLKVTVDLVPNLVFAAAYEGNGQKIANYPPAAPSSNDATTREWFRRASASELPYSGSLIYYRYPRQTRAFLLAIAINDQKPQGYLMACYGLEALDNWVKEVNVPGGSIYIVDREGSVVATSEVGEGFSARLVETEHLRRARQEGKGNWVGDLLDGRQALIGYALAEELGWVVLVVQPVRTDVAPTDYLVRRLALLLIPILGLIALTAWLLVRYYQAQEEMNTRLVEDNQAKSHFLASISHELRTPLTSALLALNSLMHRNVSSSQVRETVSMVSEDLHQILPRVRNLLDMSRLEAGALNTTREVCDLTDIVASTLEMLKPMTESRTLQAEFPTEPLMIEADQVQIQNVITNLLENALKYCPKEKPITLIGERLTTQVRLTVQDEGPGIPIGDEERIFEKFYRSETGRSIQGTGLGLAICKEIVAAHGGSIGVSNRIEGGAEFWLTLPTFTFTEEANEEEPHTFG